MRQYLTYLGLASSIFFGLDSNAQSTHLPLGNDDYFLWDRLEAKSGALSNEIFTTVKPYQRFNAVKFLENVSLKASLTEIDQYNIQQALASNAEYSEAGPMLSKKPILKHFYKYKPDLFYIKNDDFFLQINPVLSGMVYSEQHENGSQTGYWHSKGLEIRGNIKEKIGFYTYITDNQETPVSYVDRWIKARSAVPGADYYQDPKVGFVDYMQARGGVEFPVLKNYINATFAYDKVSIGDGLRSMFLSDFSANHLFLRLNTKVGRVNYQNLFMELTPQYLRGADSRLPRKYATMHHLSWNVNKWLNLGIFESTIFGRRDRFEFKYLVPVIFYRQIERALGSPDNVLLGMNFKAIPFKNFSLYGQFFLDEFRSKDLFSGNGHWANKYAWQIGGKYFDAFGLKNLDLQGEINAARPFMYSYQDSVGDYSHYNQPLAHPLGSSFIEILGRIHYQPIKRLHVYINGMYYNKGVDTGGYNLGTDIFNLNNVNKPSETGYSLISGAKNKVASIKAEVSYELISNLFVEVGATHRKSVVEDSNIPQQQSTWFSAGFRWNIGKRDWDFY